MLNSKKTHWLLWYQFHGACEQQGSESFSRPHLNMLTDPFSPDLWLMPVFLRHCSELHSACCTFKWELWYEALRLLIEWDYSKEDTCTHTHTHTHKLEAWVMGSIRFTTQTPSTQALPPHSVTPDQYGHSAFHSAHVTHMNHSKSAGVKQCFTNY